MPSDDKALGREEALRLLEEGNRRHRENDIDGAIDCYRRSAELHATAEAHTFLGWMYSHRDRLDEAIEQCKIAIELDPDFGDPYNDIGVYLMQRGELDGAEPWLRRAMAAKRYDPRHFPHINMGRIHLLRKEHDKAVGEFRRALKWAPRDPTAAALFRHVVGQLN